MTSVAQREREAGDVLSTPRTLDQIEPPTRLGRYELAYILGMGTSAVVFAAHDTKLEREVAIKVFRSHCTTEAIRREALALARIDHPNVLDLHEIGEADDLEFLVTDIVLGGTLLDIIAGSHDWREIVGLFIQAARGLAAVHEAGFTHGDVKPANILVGVDRRIQIADLGLARGSMVDRDLGGTVIYMAPERLAGAPASAAADQFALCVALWEALHGVRPWPSNTAENVGTVAPARGRLRVGVPGQLLQVIRRGLAVDARDRHESMGALEDALTRVLLDAGRRQDRRWAIAAAVATAGILLALTWLVTQFL